MTPLPPGLSVEKVLARLGIEGQAQGNRYWARCPVHDDHDPSWFVRLDGEHKGRWHCYSCQASGDLFHLVQRVRGVTFKEALAWLGAEQPTRDPGRVRFELPAPPRGFVLPPEVVVAPLGEWIPVAASYARERGITAEQVDRWRLGYAVGGRLDGRIVFPVYHVDRPVNYTARTFVDDPKRYLAADDRELPDHGAIFGEEFWPPPERRDAVCILEGAINALAVERVAPTLPLGALGGSNPTAQRVSKFCTFRRAYVFTDDDRSGTKAAALLTQSLAKAGAAIFRLHLAPGYDPASIDPHLLRECLLSANIATLDA